MALATRMIREPRQRKAAQNKEKEEHNKKAEETQRTIDATLKKCL